MSGTPDRKAAENFAKKYDVKIVDRYADMAGKVDGVILSDYYATGWWPQLSKPFLEAGIPCLINRPFALSLREAKEMIVRAGKYNTPILVPSSDETMMETIRARHHVEQLLAQGGHVTGAMAFEPCGEYAAHGVHGIYNLYTILKPNVVAAGLLAEKWWEWGDKGALMTWLVKGEEKNPDYYAAIRMSSEPDTNGWVEISTSKGRVFENNDHEGDVFTRYRNMFLSTCIEFQTHDRDRKAAPDLRAYSRQDHHLPHRFLFPPREEGRHGGLRRPARRLARPGDHAGADTEERTVASLPNRSAIGSASAPLSSGGSPPQGQARGPAPTPLMFAMALIHFLFIG